MATTTKFVKATNTRSIVAATTVNHAGTNYAPRPGTLRQVHLSWQAFCAVAKANPNGFTVATYLAEQAKVNPENVGDALPCLRYWANNGHVLVAA